MSNTAPPPTPWLFVPGHMCDARMWTGVQPAFRAAGVELMDADISLDDSIDAMAERALRLLDRPSVVCGFSMGGMVALRMQAFAPERIAGLALLDTNARADLPERARMRVEQQQRVRAGLLADVVGQEMLPHYFGRSGDLDPGFGSLILAMAEALGPDVFIRQSKAIRDRPDSTHRLRAIACPSIVLGGLNDRLCSAEWQRNMATRIKGAEQLLLPDVGHFAPLEAAAVVSEALLAWATRQGFILPDK